MKEKSKFLTLIILAIILASCSSLVITPAPGNPICLAPGNTQWTYTQSATVTDYDFSSFYYSSDKGDSLQIFVKSGGDGTNNFKFIGWDSKYQQQIVLECAGSNGTEYTFAGLVHQVLILKSIVSGNYFGYRYDPTATGPLQKLQLTIPSSITGGVYAFEPFYSWDYNNEHEFYVMISGATQSGIFLYSWTSASTVKLDPTMVGNLFPRQIVKVLGNDLFIYDKTVSKFYNLNTNTNAWEEYTGLSSTGKIVQCYFFRWNWVMFSLSAIDKLTGSLQLIADPPTPPTSIPSQASMTAYVDYSDELSNFVRVGSEYLQWIYMKSTGGIFTSNIPKSQITLTGILNIALAGNKAVILYQDKMVYYQQVANNQVQLIFTKDFTSSQIRTDTQSQYHVGVSCMCAAIKKFTCSSASLNCIVIHKAGGLCNAQESDLTA